MRVFRAGLIAVLGLAPFAIARAADMPIKASPQAEAAYNWTGLYVGANAGGVWSSFDPTSVASLGTYFAPIPLANVNAAGAQKINPASFLGGFEAGYNAQYGATVLGIEGDIEYMHLSGSQQSPAAIAGGSVAFISSAASADWLSTIRGRIGYAANNWLFFATGGAAFTTLKGTFSYADNCGANPGCNGPGTPNGVEAPLSFSNEKTGYAVGGGVETGLSANWICKVEYLYVNFSSISTTGLINAGINGTAPITHSIDLHANIMRLGLNYKF